MDNLFDHIEFISNPQWWEKEVLPVKKTIDGELECGVIHRSNLVTVKHANLFMLPKTFEEFLKLDGETYFSVPEMVANGWRVD
jgi:hypothetical protein